MMRSLESAEGSADRWKRPSSVRPAGRFFAENVSGPSPDAGMRKRNGRPGVAPVMRGELICGGADRIGAICGGVSRSTAATSSAKWAKSAERMEGAMSVGLVMFSLVSDAQRKIRPGRDGCPLSRGPLVR